ncbi:hypothetical protein B0H13DRAFT_1864658 [Mycena leptocephala]|nr:hypothetical protein B0H13DRAFT_1864658 [Mycena leptocephala]
MLLKLLVLVGWRSVICDPYWPELLEICAELRQDATSCEYNLKHRYLFELDDKFQWGDFPDIFLAALRREDPACVWDGPGGAALRLLRPEQKCACDWGPPPENELEARPKTQAQRCEGQPHTTKRTTRVQKRKCTLLHN